MDASDPRSLEQDENIAGLERRARAGDASTSPTSSGIGRHDLAQAVRAG